MLEHQEKSMNTEPLTNSMAAFSDKTEDLSSALNLLYIKSNTGGRNIFRAKFPDVAEYLFGSELIKYDNEGTDSLERRKELEHDAGARRIALKMTIADIVDKSIDKGTLQFDYVGQIIDEYGPVVSKYLYAIDIIERVRPGILVRNKSDSGASDIPKIDMPLIDEVISPKISGYDEIKPIDTPVIDEAVEDNIKTIHINYSELFNNIATVIN